MKANIVTSCWHLFIVLHRVIKQSVQSFSQSGDLNKALIILNTFFVMIFFQFDNDICRLKILNNKDGEKIVTYLF
jgi:hypothetical protein